MKLSLKNRVRHVSLAGCVAWSIASGSSTLADEKIKVSAPDKSAVLPELPKAQRPEINRPSGSALDLLGGNRGGDVGEGGAPAGSTPTRTLDPRVAKLVLEALTKQKNDSLLLRTPEFESDGSEKQNLEGQDDQAKEADDPLNFGGKERPGIGDERSRTDGITRPKSDRTTTRNREGDSRIGGTSSRSPLDRRLDDRTQAPSSALDSASKNSPFGQGEKIHVSDPFDARTQLDAARDLGTGGGLEKSARDLAQDLNDTARSTQFRNLINAPEIGVPGGVGSSGLTGAGSQPMDRAAQFRSLLSGSTRTTPSGGLSSGFTPSSLAKPAAADFGAKGAGGLPNLTPGFTPPTLTPNFIPPAPPPATRPQPQPAILPIPRRF